MKIFEDRLWGIAIVSSDLLVLSNVLVQEHNALTTVASDPAERHIAVQRLLDDATLRQRLAGQAFADLRADHTWRGRAQYVLASLGVT